MGLLLGKDRFADIDIRIRVRVADTPARSTLSDRLCLSLWLLTTRSMSTSRASKRSRTSWSSLTAPCLSLTPGGMNPRSLEVPEPEQDSRSLTVKLFIAAILYLAMLGSD